MTTNENAKGGRWVYARYIRRKDGTVVYPKNAKFFRFWVEK
ncbi:hypothetical protein GGD71_005725 [Variovorax guangxiensis]|uniref:Uncharacterized protein n=1 Tax=Variovorax guangxiensis TaxID=1775474 RepID=A0A840FQQ8_9BURK|nr:hypothetical protein [Variovorax guangxiensis]